MSPHVLVPTRVFRQAVNEEEAGPWCRAVRHRPVAGDELGAVGSRAAGDGRGHGSQPSSPTIRTVTERAGPWIEVGDRVFAKRYRFFDQQIGVVLGRGEGLVIDTRVSERQGREILDDLRELTGDPVTIVINTHWHHDHTFGNHAFWPATIWGHDRCEPRL